MGKTMSSKAEDKAVHLLSPLPVLAKENARKLLSAQAGFLAFKGASADFKGTWTGRD